MKACKNSYHGKYDIQAYVPYFPTFPQIRRAQQRAVARLLPSPPVRSWLPCLCHKFCENFVEDEGGSCDCLRRVHWGRFCQQ